MELIAVLIFIYGCKCALDELHKAWRKSKTAYMRNVDTRFPDLPKAKRAARAVQHDLGYWTAQTLRGFPAARRGFGAGWQEGRQARAEGRPVPKRPVSLWREVVPPESEDRPAAGEGREATGEGSPVTPANSTRRVDGKPETAADRRFFDLREGGYTGWIDQDGLPRPAPLAVPSAGQAGDPHACGDPDGCSCPCHSTGTEPGTPGPAAQDPAGQETGNPVEGTPVMPVAADTTYDGVLRSMADAKADAEVKEAEAQQASTNADSLADQMQGLEVDADTLSAMSDHQAAHDEVIKAHQRLFETAEAVETALIRGHAGLAEAHQNAPVEAADKSFYAD